jgi:tetratricopeptide (TPR) repeat protein
MSETATVVDQEEIQKLIQQARLPEALSALDALPVDKQESQMGLYMRAVCLRHLKQWGDAEKVLHRLIGLSPSYGRGFQELGHLYRDAGRPPEAVGAYATACHLNPALKASWLGQYKLLDHSRSADRVAQVKERLDWLEALPPVLLASLDMLHEGKLIKAEQLCRGFMQKNPQHIEGMRLLADIAIRHGVLEDAEFLLESAVAFDPDHQRARIDYVQALSKRQRYQQASEEAKALLEASPENPQFQSLYAIQSMQLGDYQTALDLFDQILERIPHDPVTHVSKGHALKTGGKTAEAVSAYQAAIDSQPMHCDAWYSLANLKTYRFDDDQIHTMLELDRNPHLAGQDRVYLQFALGKAFEDKNEFDKSFFHYSKGNDIKRNQVQYRADGTSRECEEQIAACTPDTFKHVSGHDAPDPIFIVGLPRAGSTLLEQILSSHSQIDGTLELPNVLSISGKLRRLGQREGNHRYPEILNDLTPETLRELGEEYIRDTRIHRLGAPFFIDKMPNNFRHVGLIRLMLPNAKIIDARRDPMACCFSGFKQLFAEGQLFSYSLDDIGRYYKDYVKLMAHWDEVIPGYVLRVQHEDVVADLETQVTRMLDFCGVPFEESCLEFHKTERNVRTPSSEQVRQPIFSTALEQWKNYEPWLGPLKQALGSELTSG